MWVYVKNDDVRGQKINKTRSIYYDVTANGVVFD